MSILTLDPNALYQIELIPTRDPDEPSWSTLGLGPDGVSRALAVILAEFLKGLDGDPGERHYLGFALNSQKKQIAAQQALEPKRATAYATVDELEDSIAKIEFVLAKAPFIAEVVSSPLSALSAGNFYGDTVEEGVDDLFTDGAPRDVLHLLYGFAASIPFWKFSVTTPTIYR